MYVWGTKVVDQDVEDQQSKDFFLIKCLVCVDKQGKEKQLRCERRGCGYMGQNHCILSHEKGTGHIARAARTRAASSYGEASSN